MFCIAITIVTKSPRAAVAPRPTPIAIHSAPECIVITIIRINACLRESFLCSVLVMCSCFSAKKLVNIINTSHIIIPRITAPALVYSHPPYHIP